MDALAANERMPHLRPVFARWREGHTDSGCIASVAIALLLPAPSPPPPTAAHRLAVADADPARPPRHGAHDAASDDFLSDRATRERASPQPLEAVLPPLTSSNDVDTQLYAIIAIVIKDFVKSWYSAITPDHAFVDEIIHTIAHCTRALEQRLRRTDVIALLLDEAPALLERHITAYRTATHPQAALAHAPSARHIYHALNPHPALDPDQSPDQQARSAAAYRQLLVDGVLACLLPTEDVQNTSLRMLVTDIVAHLILRQAIDDKFSDPAFLYGLVSIGVRSASSAHRPKSTPRAAVDAAARSRLDKFGLLPAQHQGPNPSARASPLGGLQSSLLLRFWALVHLVYRSLVAVRFIIFGLLRARQRPARLSFAVGRGPRAPKRARVRPVDESRSDGLVVHCVLDYRLFSALSTLLNMPRRMPWLVGFLAFWRHLLSASTAHPSAFSSLLDRSLHLRRNVTDHARYICIFKWAINHEIRPQALSMTRSRQQRFEQFVYNALEQHVFVPSVKQVYYATTSEEDMRRAVEEEVLQVFDDSYMNKHLLYAIVELIVVALVPELADKTPAELLADRGVAVVVSSSSADKTV
ncbi:hypothetical protein DV737_g3139, partial [Chaetothyriales sp. CBS 132003]